MVVGGCGGSPQAVWEAARLPSEILTQREFLELPNLLEIIPGRLGQATLLQPATTVGMPFMNEHKRAQSRLLATGRKQQCQIKAGAELLADYIGREPNFLPGIFKTRGRVDIADAKSTDSPLNRGNLIPRPLAAPVLIAIDRIPPGGFTEQLRRPTKNRHHRRIIRQNKRRQDFR